MYWQDGSICERNINLYKSHTTHDAVRSTKSTTVPVQCIADLSIMLLQSAASTLLSRGQGRRTKNANTVQRVAYVQNMLYVYYGIPTRQAAQWELLNYSFQLTHLTTISEALHLKSCVNS